jgi:hypothetical protein
MDIKGNDNYFMFDESNSDNDEYNNNNNNNNKMTVAVILVLVALKVNGCGLSILKFGLAWRVSRHRFCGGWGHA